MKRIALSLIAAIALTSTITSVSLAAKKKAAAPPKPPVTDPASVDKYTGEYTGDFVVAGSPRSSPKAKANTAPC